MPNDKIDLSGSLRGQVSVKPEEDPDDKAARLRSETRIALIDDCKGIAVFILLYIAITAIGLLAVYEAFFDTAATVDTKRWCQTILSALIAGGISFVVGRKMGK